MFSSFNDCPTWAWWTGGGGGGDGGGGGGHGDDGGGHDKNFHLHKNISPIFFPPEISKSSTLMLPIRNTTNTNVDEKMDNKSFDSFQ